MTVRPIILNSQQAVYVVLKYPLDEDALDETDWEDVHSFWSSRAKAEEVAEFIRWEHDEACVLEINYDQPIRDVRGYSIVININDYTCHSIRSAITRNQCAPFDLTDQDKVKEALINDPHLSQTVIFPGGVKRDSIPEFNCGAGVYDEASKVDGHWVYHRSVQPPLGLYVRGFGFTAVEAYESAIEYAIYATEVLDSLPEKRCAICNTEIKKEYNYDSHPIVSKNKSDGTFDYYECSDTIFEKEFMFACGSECQRKLTARYFQNQLDNYTL